MGAKNESRTEVKKKIESEISTTITNITENITKVVNQTTNDTTTKMVQETKASVKIQNQLANVIKSKNITAIGSSIDINQDASLQAENLAIISIVQSASAMADLANKVAADVDNKLKNDSAAKASMAQVAAIAETQKQAGGPEQMVDSIMKTVDGMVKGLSQIGGGSTDTNISETEIRNKIKTDILNKTLNQNEITNIVTNTIKNEMTQAAEGSCNMDTSGQNTLDVDNIVALAIAGERSDIKIKQTVSLKAFNKCFLDLNMGNAIVNKMGIDTSMTAKSETANTSSTDSTSKQEASIVSTKIQESAIMSSIDNLVNNIGSIFKISPMMMMMVVGGGLTAAIAAYFYSTSQKGEGDGDGDGGNKGSENVPLDADGNPMPKMDADGNPMPKMDADGNPIEGNPDQNGGFFRYRFNNNYLNYNDTESSLAGMEETELFGGGSNINDYGNIYLWALVAVLVYYVYGKSLPMSSVLVIVIIGYIIYTIKNKKP